jgi:hypothetical protein
MATEPKPTPKQSESPDSEETRQNPGDETSTPERDGFFKRVRRKLQSKPIHPSEEAEIVVMEGDGD